MSTLQSWATMWHITLSPRHSKSFAACYLVNAELWHMVVQVCPSSPPPPVVLDVFFLSAAARRGASRPVSQPLLFAPGLALRGRQYLFSLGE